MNIIGQNARAHMRHLGRDYDGGDDAGRWDRIDLRVIIAVLRRQIVTFLATMLVLLALSALVASQLGRMYTATTLLVVDARDAQLLGFDTGATDGSGVNAAVDTQVEIAQSPKILARAAETLHLQNAAEFATQPSLLDRLLFLIRAKKPAEAPPDPSRTFAQLSGPEQASLLDRFAKRLSIARRGVTSVIAVSASSNSPDDAARMADAVANAYLDEQIDSKLGSTQRAISFLRGRVASLDGDVRRIETELADFSEKTLSNLDSPELRTVFLQLKSQTKDREQSQLELQLLQTGIKSANYAALANLVDSQDTKLAQRRAVLTAQLASPSPTLRPEEVKRDLLALDDEIRAASEKRAAALGTQLAADSANIAETRKQLEATLSTSKLPQDISAELFRLQREAETSRNLFTSFLGKLRQVEQQTDFNVPDSRIVSPATPPDHPSFPPLKLMAAATMILSIGVGLSLAFLRDHFIGGFTNVEQLEAATGLLVLSTIPRHKTYGPGQRVDRLIVDQPFSQFSEGIRRLRIGLEAAGPQERLCVFVTSSVAQEGKTTTALSLARAFALAGRSTILIDADMRHPTVHKCLGCTVDEGLCEFLSRGAVEDIGNLAMAKETATGLSFVFGSEMNAMPTDALLVSERFAALMSHMRDSYEIVVVDTPPAGLVVDAEIVARHADVGVFVVRHAFTNQHQVRSTLRDFRRRSDVPLWLATNMVGKGEGYGEFSSYYVQKS